MAIYAQQLTIYLYSAHRAVIFAIAQLSCLKHNECVLKGSTRIVDPGPSFRTRRLRI